MAQVVNRVISNLTGEQLNIRGLGPESDVVSYETDQPTVEREWAYISRTNGDLLRVAEAAISKGYSLYMRGVFKAFILVR